VKEFFNLGLKFKHNDKQENIFSRLFRNKENILSHFSLGLVDAGILILPTKIL